MSPILVTLTSPSDSNFERSNINLKENKRDDIDSNSNSFDYCVRMSEGKILWFSADCLWGNCGDTKLIKLLKIQNRAALSITGSGPGKKNRLMDHTGKASSTFFPVVSFIQVSSFLLLLLRIVSKRANTSRFSRSDFTILPDKFPRVNGALFTNVCQTFFRLSLPPNLGIFLVSESPFPKLYYLWI